jgi:hypothetical protein
VIERYIHKAAIFFIKNMFTTIIFSCLLSAIFQPIFIANIDVDFLNWFRYLYADLDSLFSDINCHLLLKIRENKLNLLIHTNIYHCKLDFLVSRAGTIMRRSTIPLGQQSLDLQGISSHISLHSDLTSRGYTSISIHPHLIPPRVTRIASLE